MAWNPLRGLPNREPLQKFLEIVTDPNPHAMTTAFVPLFYSQALGSALKPFMQGERCDDENLNRGWQLQKRCFQLIFVLHLLASTGAGDAQYACIPLERNDSRRLRRSR